MCTYSSSRWGSSAHGRQHLFPDQKKLRSAESDFAASLRASSHQKNMSAVGLLHAATRDQPPEHGQNVTNKTRRPTRHSCKRVSLWSSVSLTSWCPAETFTHDFFFTAAWMNLEVHPFIWLQLIDLITETSLNQFTRSVHYRRQLFHSQFLKTNTSRDTAHLVHWHPQASHCMCNIILLIVINYYSSKENVFYFISSFYPSVLLWRYILSPSWTGEQLLENCFFFLLHFFKSFFFSYH